MPWGSPALGLSDLLHYYISHTGTCKKTAVYLSCCHCCCWHAMDVLWVSSSGKALPPEGQHPAPGCFGNHQRGHLSVSHPSPQGRCLYWLVSPGESPAAQREEVTGTQEHPCSSAGNTASLCPGGLLPSFTTFQLGCSWIYTFLLCVIHD